MTVDRTATAKLAELEEAARRAEQGLAEIRQRQAEQSSNVARLRSERLRLAVEQPGQFDEHGRPRKGTDAAKLDAER